MVATTNRDRKRGLWRSVGLKRSFSAHKPPPGRTCAQTKLGHLHNVGCVPATKPRFPWRGIWTHAERLGNNVLILATGIQHRFHPGTIASAPTGEVFHLRAGALFRDSGAVGLAARQIHLGQPLTRGILFLHPAHRFHQQFASGTQRQFLTNVCLVSIHRLRAEP
jgi:hypothetical protein